MNNTQNTTIVLLTVTAAILAAMLLPTLFDEGSVAYGDGSVRQGKYIMATGGYDKNIDLIYVINIETQKLVVYAPNRGRRTLDKMGLAVPLQSTAATRK